MILDVGCGLRAKGDVNLDLYLGYNPHHRVDWNPRKVKNFIQGDALNLPFRDNSFSYLISTHVMEHLINPIKYLEEAKRVVNGIIEIRVPSEFSECRQTYEKHIYSWNIHTLKNFLKIKFNNVNVRYKTSFYLDPTRKIKKFFALLPLYEALLGRLGMHSEIQAIIKLNKSIPSTTQRDSK